MPTYNPKLKIYARELRQKMTEAEIKLWSYLRNQQIENSRWYRQRPIGGYIVDFYCHKYKLIVELDGSQHSEDGAQQYDARRDSFLTSLGFRILRFDNHETLTNIEGVVERIREMILGYSVL